MSEHKFMKYLVWISILCVCSMLLVFSRIDSLEKTIKEKGYEIVQLKLDKETLKSENQRLTYEIEKEGNGDE